MSNSQFRQNFSSREPYPTFVMGKVYVSSSICSLTGSPCPPRVGSEGRVVKTGAGKYSLVLGSQFPAYQNLGLFVSFENSGTLGAASATYRTAVPLGMGYTTASNGVTPVTSASFGLVSGSNPTFADPIGDGLISVLAICGNGGPIF